MIKNVQLLEKFNKQFIASNRLSYSQALTLIESLWKEGMHLGVLPQKDLLEGIEVDISVAKILNKCSKK